MSHSSFLISVLFTVEFYSVAVVYVLMTLYSCGSLLIGRQAMIYFEPNFYCSLYDNNF